MSAVDKFNINGLGGLGITNWKFAKLKCLKKLMK